MSIDTISEVANHANVSEGYPRSLLRQNRYTQMLVSGEVYQRLF